MEGKVKLIAKHRIEGKETRKPGDVFESPMDIAERLITSMAAIRYDDKSLSRLTIKIAEIEKNLKNCGSGIIDIMQDGSVTSHAIGGHIAFTVTYDSTGLGHFIPKEERESRASKILADVKDKIVRAGRGNGYEVTFV